MAQSCAFVLLENIIALAGVIIILLSLLIFIAAVLKFTNR